MKKTTKKTRAKSAPKRRTAAEDQAIAEACTDAELAMRGAVLSLQRCRVAGISPSALAMAVGDLRRVEVLSADAARHLDNLLSELLGAGLEELLESAGRPAPKKKGARNGR